MEENITLHLGHYRKYLLESNNLIFIVTDDFNEVDISRHLYEEQYKILQNSDQDLLKIMGACALGAASLSDKEAWGWTLSLPGNDIGYFCGVEPEGSICGQVKPADASISKVYLQRQKKTGNAPMVQSHYEPETNDPVKTIEQYFLKVEQIKTRIELDDSFSGVLVQALPQHTPDDYFTMDAARLKQTVHDLIKNKTVKPLNEFLVFYDCRCNDEMILDMVEALSSNQQEPLWDENNKIEMECPRCGRKYVIEKKDTLN